jgi:hypothetical protein
MLSAQLTTVIVTLVIESLSVVGTYLVIRIFITLDQIKRKRHDLSTEKPWIVRLPAILGLPVAYGVTYVLASFKMPYIGISAVIIAALSEIVAYLIHTFVRAKVN